MDITTRHFEAGCCSGTDWSDSRERVAEIHRAATDDNNNPFAKLVMIVVDRTTQKKRNGRICAREGRHDSSMQLERHYGYTNSQWKTKDKKKERGIQPRATPKETAIGRLPKHEPAVECFDGFPGFEMKHANPTTPPLQKCSIKTPISSPRRRQQRIEWSKSPANYTLISKEL